MKSSQAVALAALPALVFALLAQGCRPQAAPPRPATATATAFALDPDRPVIEKILDGEAADPAAAVLWDRATGQAPPRVRPGKKVILVGRNFGPGPLAGTLPPSGLTVPVSEPGQELSKVLVGKVRALERDMPVYPGRIDLKGVAQAILQGIDLYHEDFVENPDRWRGDILSWSDTEIVFTIPITAWEGPIVVWRNRPTGEFITDVTTGEPIEVRDPNTARVRKFSGLRKSELAFTDTYTIARVGGNPLSSPPVPVRVARGGDERFLAGGGEPTGRSARDQFDYGEKTYWAHDWNLGLVHLVLGVNWDAVFGFEPRQRSKAGLLFKPIAKLFGEIEDEDAPVHRVPPELAYPNPLLTDEHGDPLMQRPLRDRWRGGPVNPFEDFGAIGFDDSYVLPRVAKSRVVGFTGETPYPVPMTIRVPPKDPLLEGHTWPTGWVGYNYAEARHPIPGDTVRKDGSESPNGEWIGFNCAGCHTREVVYEGDARGTRVTKILNGIPNPQWKLSFLALSGTTRGLVEEEPLPETFVRAGYPSHEAVEEHEEQVIDRSVLMVNAPRGTAEKTMLPKAGSASFYANDYFLSPQAIPIITNHTPVRRALSHFEILAGFEGAYLHGEEPDGTRGPMSSRALQDLTLYVSTMDQDDELMRRIGMYRWLAHKGKLDEIGDVREGEFISFGYPEGAVVGAEPPTFPPPPTPAGGLADLRDHGDGAMAQAFPRLAQRIRDGKAIFYQHCERCHTDNNFGTWTNEDMHPIAGGEDPTGKYFSPTLWNRQVQSIRVAILQNLFWVQARGLLSDGHVHSLTPGDEDDIDALETLVHPDRCRPDSALYQRLYTLNDHTYRVPKAGRPVTISERGNRFSTPPGAPLVTPEQELFVRRHAYFSERDPDDGFLYWDYQKMRREYGILEHGLDPVADADRIGGLPAAPHPWCADSATTQDEIDNLVAFLLTL